jgi:hypothetical protein
MLSSELLAQRIAGPFLRPPFDPFFISPLGLVPKKEHGKFRLIHDLSYSPDGAVNDYIGSDDAAVQYEILDHVIDLIQLCGAGARIAKIDIESAFRIIPIHPDDWHLLGFSFDGAFYFDKCLPMGCRSSCAIFERFSSALQWVALNRLQIPYISHILDDFIFVGPPGTDVADRSLHQFLAFCHDCGIPIKDSKTVLPSTCVVAHGIELDTELRQARLPFDKLDRARDLLLQFKARKSVKLRELQSLLGLLNFACRVISPGRPFLRRLINLTLHVNNPHHHIGLTNAARADIEAWLLFLSAFNGVAFFQEVDPRNSDSLKLYSDASGALGFAAVFGHRWLAAAWPASWPDFHITTKELFPIVLLLEVWGPLLSQKRVLFFSDNLAVVHIINKQTCRDPTTMSLVRRLVIAAMKFNVLFKSSHIPGFSNVIADKLSRLSFQEARALAPWLDHAPTPIPAQLMFIGLHT